MRLGEGPGTPQSQEDWWVSRAGQRLQSLSSGSHRGQDPLAPGRFAHFLAESGLEPNPLCSKARVLSKQPGF